MPVGRTYRPDPRHGALGDLFYDAVEPARFPAETLRWRNDRAAATVGLDTLTDAEWLRHFARFEPLPGNLPTPLALRYHGHQFRAYNPDLGDGRGFLHAQVRDERDRLLDLGTKGSGTTPWSRSGDGRLTLKGAVRELLATETLEARGVPTSRTFSIVETGEELWRGDEPSPTRSAVLVRLSHSHIRIGTFQRLAYHGEGEAIGRLVSHCGGTYGLGDGDPVRFLEAVTARVADTGAAWWAAGFVHGVLNTDNINVTGESFDYGPWRFLEAHDPTRVAAYFDQTGLYAFARQPEALQWNLARLAECLLAVAEDARDAMIAVLETFPALFEDALVRRTLLRLGVAGRGGERAGERGAEAGAEEDRALVRGLYAAMRRTQHPHERAFHDLRGGADAGRIAASPLAADYETEPWRDVVRALRGREATIDAATGPDAPVTMDHAQVESAWDAIARDDDWTPLATHVHRARHADRARHAGGG